MAKQGYRELVAWQKSMQMVKAVYQVSSGWPKTEIYGLTSQIRRAAVSVPSNIAEGHGRRSNKEFLRFLNIAHGSLMEVETQLQIAYLLNFATQERLDQLLKITDEIGRVFYGLISSLQQPARTK